MKIIGLTGFAKSGKSTAAEMLKSIGGQEVAFAKHLKDVCAVVFRVPRENFDDQKVKEVPFNFELRIMPIDIVNILNYFEVPARFIPEAILKHDGVQLLSPRHVAQYIGTEVLRTIDTDIHVNMAFRLNANPNVPFLICSDVRFDNELKAVQRTGAVIGISRKAAVPADLENLHPSEKEIPTLIKQSNSIIENETSIEEFQAKVKETSLYLLGPSSGNVTFKSGNQRQ